MALSEDTKVHTEQNRFSANSDVAGPIGAFIKVCVQHQQEPHHPHVSIVNNQRKRLWLHNKEDAKLRKLLHGDPSDVEEAFTKVR